jgi:hypothetical protein
MLQCTLNAATRTLSTLVALICNLRQLHTPKAPTWCAHWLPIALIIFQTCLNGFWCEQIHHFKTQRYIAHAKGTNMVCPLAAHSIGCFSNTSTWVNRSISWRELTPWGRSQRYIKNMHCHAKAGLSPMGITSSLQRTPQRPLLAVVAKQNRKAPRDRRRVNGKGGAKNGYACRCLRFGSSRMGMLK